MKDNVLIKISGLHLQGSDSDTVEMINTGKYFFREGKHYIKYQESLEEGMVSDNMIKIGRNEVELIRKGTINTNMVFTTGQKNVSYYETPFGMMSMGIDTTELDITQTDDAINIELMYALDMNCEHVSNCHVRIDISEAH